MSSTPSKFQCKKCHLYFSTKQGLNLHRERVYPCIQVKNKPEIKTENKPETKKDTVINTGKTIEKLVDKIKIQTPSENKNILIEEEEEEPVIMEKNSFDKINDKITKLSYILEILKNKDLMKNINNLNNLINEY